MKIVQSAIVALACLAGSACETVPPLDFTVPEVGRVAQRKDAELLSMTVGFAPQTAQRVMETDASIPPIWKESLTDAINRSLIFTDGSSKKLNLSVRIVEVDAPGGGGALFTEKTSVAAIYEIVDRKTGDIILSQEIRTEGGVPMTYAFAGIVRHREGVNRAVRNNIAEFIALLETTDFGRPAFPVQ